MRVLRLAVAAALTFVAMPAVAGSCCGEVTVVYGIPPLVPLPGDLFDPSDRAAPVYIVDQGPVLSGPGIYIRHDIYVPPFARPTAWGDYAVVPGTGGRPFPYVRHAWRPAYLPYGVAPYGASAYRPARSARFIRVR